MAVELVRSCYVGTWRLFRGRPDILTRLRYYFLPDDTPVYTGWHYFGSANWVHDAEAPYEPPPLGEDRTERTVYSTGDFGTDLPPGVVLGSADCLAFGEPDFPPLPGRRLIAGVDTRCWTERGLPLPDQVPFLWLRDTGLRPAPADGPFVKWLDSAIVPNDCTVFTQPPAPAVATVAGRRLVFVQAGETVGLGLPFVLGRNFAFHAVCTTLPFFGGSASSVSVVGPFGPQCICRLAENTWTINPAAGVQLIINHGLGWGGPRLFSVRCEDWHLVAHLDGVDVGQMQLSEGMDFRCVFGSCSLTGVSGLFFAGLGEAKVYRDWCGDTQYQADMTALKAYWAIP